MQPAHFADWRAFRPGPYPSSFEQKKNPKTWLHHLTCVISVSCRLARHYVPWSDGSSRFSPTLLFQTPSVRLSSFPRFVPCCEVTQRQLTIDKFATSLRQILTQRVTYKPKVKSKNVHKTQVTTRQQSGDKRPFSFSFTTLNTSNENKLELLVISNFCLCFTSLRWKSGKNKRNPHVGSLKSSKSTWSRSQNHSFSCKLPHVWQTLRKWIHSPKSQISLKAIQIYTRLLRNIASPPKSHTNHSEYRQSFENQLSIQCLPKPSKHDQKDMNCRSEDLSGENKTR